MDSHCVPNKNSWFSWLCSWLQSPLLLAIRLIWGIMFILTGAGKLGNISQVIEFFNSLQIPNPVFFAWLVALTELIGGALIVLGLWTRVAAIPLIAIMVVAYATDSRETVLNIFHRFSSFYESSTVLFFACHANYFCVWPRLLFS